MATRSLLRMRAINATKSSYRVFPKRCTQYASKDVCLGSKAMGWTPPPSMRFVAVKTVQQQDIQAMHRIRSGLIEQRTAKGNQIRGLVAEYGLVAPKELSSLRRAIPCWMEDVDNGLSACFRQLLDGLWRDLRAVDDRISELDRTIADLAQADPVRVDSNNCVAWGPSWPRR
jgi:transposase